MESVGSKTAMKITVPAIIGLTAALVLFLVAITIIGSVDIVPAPPLPVEPDLLTRHVNLTKRVNPEHFYGFISGGVQAVGQFKRALSADEFWW